MKIHNAVFWIVTLPNVVRNYQSFGGNADLAFFSGCFTTPSISDHIMQDATISAKWLFGKDLKGFGNRLTYLPFTSVKEVSVVVEIRKKKKSLIYKPALSVVTSFFQNYF